MWYFVEKIVFSQNQRKHRRFVFLTKLLSPLSKELDMNDIELKDFCRKIAKNQSFRYWNAELDVFLFHPIIGEISFKRISLFRKKYEITFYNKNGEEIVGKTFCVSL